MSGKNWTSFRVVKEQLLLKRYDLNMLVNWSIVNNNYQVHEFHEQVSPLWQGWLIVWCNVSSKLLNYTDKCESKYRNNQFMKVSSTLVITDKSLHRWVDRLIGMGDSSNDHGIQDRSNVIQRLCTNYNIKMKYRNEIYTSIRYVNENASSPIMARVIAKLTCCGQVKWL